MKFGWGLYGTGGPKFVNIDLLVAVAQRADALGFDSLWTGDRVVMPIHFTSLHPLIAGGRIPIGGEPEDNAMEPLCFLAYLGAMTNHIRLGTSVLVLPYRHPVLMSKMVATLDYLIGGRVLLGVSVGWMEEEFNLLGSPLFSARGAVTDEVIQVFKAMCTQDEPVFNGKFFSVSGITAYPKPAQRPHPPIWIGGHSKAALRRTARLGDAWHPIGLGAEEVARGKATLETLCQEVGRDPASVEIGVKCNLDLHDKPSTVNNRPPFSGNVDQIKEDVNRFKDIGVHSLSFRPAVGTRAVEDLSEILRWLETMALVKEEFA